MNFIQSYHIQYPVSAAAYFFFRLTLFPVAICELYKVSISIYFVIFSLFIVNLIVLIAFTCARILYFHQKNVQCFIFSMLLKMLNIRLDAIHMTRSRMLSVNKDWTIFAPNMNNTNSFASHIYDYFIAGVRTGYRFYLWLYTLIIELTLRSTDV